MNTNESETLDEGLLRLHETGPEFQGWLSNHGPMAVEALVRHGEGDRVHRWIDVYRERLEERPGSYGRITAENWREALGDPRYLADWATYFGELLRERPWREVLAEWWPRMLPGITAGATHPVIRVGHAVRVLLAEGESGPRLAELAHGLGYWAARHQELPASVAALPAPASAGEALRAVQPVDDRSQGINYRLAQISRLPAWADTVPDEPEAVRERLASLVRAAVGYYATHAHGNPVMLVHAATAPNAVLRTLPALPRELWSASLGAAWTASAGVVASYAPAQGPLAPADTGGAGPEEMFARAAAHGDEHAIKLADTALDVVAADPEGPGLSAAARAVELIEPD
ncbi:questin oxidase family protein [Streptomyces hoynatensis]|uniref:Questin oxidase family protein n=1 Tax=Streptomyces hoynatensis TaxID=1141874 RepID=A0A3A9YRM3_9ACTN|nr:questin oxidase family protein [Streptomyces hoynatensis]RKN38585.1 questin oxidase family protein [Streptomyces hoynatensis]